MTIAFLPSASSCALCSGNVQSYVLQQLWSVRVSVCVGVWVCARACNQQLKTTTTTINFLSHIKLVVLSLHFTTTHLGVIIIIKWPRRACQAAALWNWNAFHGACMGSCAHKVVKTLPQTNLKWKHLRLSRLSCLPLVLSFFLVPSQPSKKLCKNDKSWV